MFRLCAHLTPPCPGCNGTGVVVLGASVQNACPPGCPAGLAGLKPGHYNAALHRFARGSLGFGCGFVGLVALGGWQVPIPLYGLGIGFALDSD